MLSENEEKIRKELQKLMKHFECAVCLNLMSDPLMTRCLHRFCGVCITKAIESSSGDFCRCPLCNEKITKRSLRPQIEVSDLTIALKEAVLSFESDNQKSIITDAEDVVIFDLSTDKSKTCAQINDSLLGNNDSIASVNKNEKSLNGMNGNNDIETNRKTTVTDSGDWPTCQSTPSNTSDINKTELYFETTKSSINAETDGNGLKNNEDIEEILNKSNEENEPQVEALPTQSQNLKVKKSGFTYGNSSRSHSSSSTNDLFDRIIGLTVQKNDGNDKKENKRNEKVVQKSKTNVSKEYVSSESETETNQRKPLIQRNKNINQKKKRKMEAIVSSDDDLSSPLVVITKRRVPIITDSDTRESQAINKSLIVDLDSDMSDEDLGLPSINRNNHSIELNRSKVMDRSEDREGYNSDTQLIGSDSSGLL